MMKRALVLTIILAVAVTFAAAGDKPLKRNSKIFIEKIEGDLNGFIIAAMVKQKVPLDVLLSSEDADYVFLKIGKARLSLRMKVNVNQGEQEKHRGDDGKGGIFKN
jgi:hypothetical protein